MADLKRCDTCQTEQPHPAFGWLTVAWVETDYMSMDMEPGPWDFCSWNCVRDFALKKTTGRSS